MILKSHNPKFGCYIFFEKCHNVFLAVMITDSDVLTCVKSDCNALIIFLTRF